MILKCKCFSFTLNTFNSITAACKPPTVAYCQQLYLQQSYNKSRSASSQYYARMNQNYSMCNTAPIIVQIYDANQQHFTNFNSQQSRRRLRTYDRRNIPSL